MRCPFCDHLELKVIDKRTHSNDTIRRRRECLKCEKRFTTYEKIETTGIRVVKKSGEREQFDRLKVLNGILKACEKRPVTTEQINQAVREIETEIRSNDTEEIHSQIVGELVMEKLKQLDKVAYVRFASVYKDFADVKSFEELIKSLKGGK
ncbi:transcriptional regulator NrdR [Candidatus Woesearchaeota archaeon]|nr:transcriptional regulator NrdR [Candidatus Woesearchaeota archaeon]